MTNVEISIENQIIKLRNRDMILDCKEEKIKEILLDIGYYRLGFIGIILKLILSIILKRALNSPM